MELVDNLKGIFKLALRLVIFSLLIFASFEVALRAAGHVSEIGQFTIGGVAIPPFPTDYDKIRRGGRAAMNPDANNLYLYDEDLGYTLRPNYGRRNILINSQGIRAPRRVIEYTLEPAPDVLRIALLGDSNVYGGGGVSYEETWGYILEQTLNERGIPTEVINFGVPAYSPTQSELRWEYDARAFHPDIVIFGSNNRLITVAANMHRSFVLDDTTPFLAPLYYLDGDELMLVNHPAVSPLETADILENFQNHPFSQYEQHDQPPPFWMRSRMLAMLSLSFNTTDQEDYGMNTVDVRTFIAIIDHFAASVEDADAVFIYTHLAGTNAIRMNVGEGQLPFQPIFDDIASRHHFIDTMDLFPFINEADWVASHYTLNAAIPVGHRMADYIEACLADGSCTPPRFQSE